MAETYVLTVKFAPRGTSHYNRETKKWETSTWGHVWLEARKPGKILSGV